MLPSSLRPRQFEVRDIGQTSDKNDLSIREMMEDTMATGQILKSNKPWRTAASKLYHEFLEIIQGHSSEPQIFDTIADFIQNCTDTLQIMRGKTLMIHLRVKPWKKPCFCFIFLKENYNLQGKNLLRIYLFIRGESKGGVRGKKNHWPFAPLCLFNKFTQLIFTQYFQDSVNLML